MFRLSRPIGRVATRFSARSIFTVAEMPHLDKARGIPGLYSPEGLDVAWFQYQQLVVDKLNELTREHPEVEDLTPFQLMQTTSTNPELFEINYYASQAYNNEFFFAGLRDSSVNKNATAAAPTPEQLRHVDISTTVLNSVPTTVNKSKLNWLSGAMKDSFDSELSFRELLINRAAGAFGNGYSWLVGTNNHLYVLSTYNHGNPIEPEPTEQQRVDTVAGQRLSTATKGMSLAATNLVPLVSINTWQHAYLTDYGIEGKRKFVENVYDCINWDTVSKRLGDMYIREE